MSGKAYTVNQVAAMLNLKPETVRAYCTRGKIRALKVGRGYRIPKRELEKWVETSKRKFAYRSRGGTEFKVEICKLSELGTQNPSFFYISSSKGDSFFFELYISPEYLRDRDIELTDRLKIIYDALEQNVREPKRIEVLPSGIYYGDIVPDLEF
ncbi:MAG: helix-turn-helix domain-containing protein [Actinomycetota bacterium]